MKRLSAALLALALLLTACAPKPAPSGTSSGTARPEQPTQSVQSTQSSRTAPEESSIAEPEDTSYSIDMVFGGDFNFDESWDVMEYALTQPNTVLDCIDPVLVEAMRDADLCCLNNEFTYSTRGKPMSGKAFTFRADPEQVHWLSRLGVDVVTLANNHIFDYGGDAFVDTLNTLTEENIDFLGAGLTLDEAAAPIYRTIDGVTIGFVNASRAEKNRKTPGATSDSPGILLCYDTDRFVQSIQEAKAHADFVVCLVHWGTEYSYELEAEQKETARLYLDSGADVIVGGHSHCLQGVEYYKNKPIFYSLGNYWFNKKTLETGLLRLTLTGDAETEPSLSCTFLPAIQEKCVTRYAASDEDRDRVLGLMNRISVNAVLADDGAVSEKAED